MKQVDEIVNYQKELKTKRGKYEIFNCLYITYCEQNDPPFEMIDGQHRFSAFERLYNISGNFKIEYKIIICKNADEAYSYFEIINKSKPLVLHRNRNESQEIRKLTTHMKQKYKSYIKQSQTPRIPNINLSKLEIHLRDHKVVSKCIERNVDIIDVVEKLNSFYQHVDEISPGKWDDWGILQHQIELEQPKFYLGLFKNFEWICHLLKHLEENLSYETFQHRSCVNMERITKKLRKDLWKKHFSEAREGLCYCCNDPINEDNYQVGHVISRVKGGDTKIDNLKPICIQCNQDMKIENMEEYKKRVENQTK